MNRKQQVRKVEQGFEALAAFAAGSWSNLAIVDQVKSLQQLVRPLYEVPETAHCGTCAAREELEAERRARGQVETGWPAAGERWG
ncbi:hypothetical protein [Hydrogenophaga sp.]|uniref:hypothetical protein n=1 Tax=Hydrogenophaga sp. TaxID=1904254 RepID=UPI003D0BD5F2